MVHHPGFLHLIASVLFSSDTLQCTVEEECKMFAQNVGEFLVSVQISVERGKISAGVERSLCLPFSFLSRSTVSSLSSSVSLSFSEAPV